MPFQDIQDTKEGQTHHDKDACYKCNTKPIPELFNDCAMVKITNLIIYKYMQDKAKEVNPFGYFKPADNMLPIIQETRNAYTNVHKFLLSLPVSRQRAVAITELETSCMWAIKGLVLNDINSTQPEESGVTGA